MRKKGLIYSLVVLFLFVFVSVAAAQDKITPQKVIKRVDKAAKYLSEKGEAGLKAFDSKDSQFVTKGLYPYVSECAKNTCAAHPISPELVGKDLSNLQDPKGNYFALEICMISKDKPKQGGWIKYWWPKPGESEASQKFVYVKKAMGTPYTVIAGFYSDDYTVKKLNEMLK